MNDAPPDLGDAGQRLWADMHLALGAEHEFTEKDYTLLLLAARQMDDISLLQSVLATDGPIVTGSQGQRVLSSVVTELRNARAAVARLLKEINTGEENMTPTELARRAARARWGGRPAPNNRVLPEAK